MTILMTILAFSLSVLVVAKLLPSVHVRGLGSAIGVAIVYGLLKFFFYKILVFMSMPFIFITLGLFLIVINAGLLWTTDKLIDGFKIDGLFSTLVASVLISILDVVFRWVLPWV
jgi:putative membrane protein